MARIARIVVPGVPHHITQRGNRRQRTFFRDQDYLSYKGIMSEWCAKWKVEVWAYCLMPNHVHLIAVPMTAEGLGKAIGESHRRYTRLVNFRERWKGFLWQGRFASFPMDERYLLAAARYVEMNPVRAGLSATAESYPWSSASAHMAGKDDGLVKAGPLLEIAGDWKEFLGQGVKSEVAERIRIHENTGRPLGSIGFIERIEGLLSRPLLRKKPGPKPKVEVN